MHDHSPLKTLATGLVGSATSLGAAASVGFGVPVDATTCTAYLSQSDVLAAALTAP